MRQPDIIEEELIEIAALGDEETKLNRIIVWCATHPDEVPFAMHALLGGRIVKPDAKPDAK
jgi:hypothetical protein